MPVTIEPMRDEFQLFNDTVAPHGLKAISDVRSNYEYVAYFHYSFSVDKVAVKGTKLQIWHSQGRNDIHTLVSLTDGPHCTSFLQEHTDSIFTTGM